MAEGSTKRVLLLDLGFYAVCLTFAAASAVWSEFYGYRVWGNLATAAYLFGVLHAVWLMIDSREHTGFLTRLRSRWTPLAAVMVLGMLVPLAILVVRRLTGVDWLITPISWAAQPEVWVIERSADLLLHTGTPYVDVNTLGRAVEVNDYTPYGPVMAIFGLPRAIFGGGALTDARLYFALAAALCVVAALKILGAPKIPVRAAQLAVACPLTALTFAVAGPDLAIIGALILAGALAARHRPEWATVVLAVVTSMKLTALPAVGVIAFLVLATGGARVFARCAAIFVAVCLALNVPVLLVDPDAYIEHVIRFWLGMGKISSPAASPFPGHLIAESGPAGHAVALGLLGVAAVTILAWLVRRPPTTGSDAMMRAAVSLGAAALLTPATRFGYLVYPLTLFGAALTFSVAEQEPARSATDEPRRSAM
ncbi:uncharacterized protein DUF2029 [Herbihabitans rhizosphaerae]|uniref:Uncharacterized protein DUF2029 n=1 Tax=Herbihabitans rhizosphaerae TaxID=1872711 RepID=A0A4Q7L1G6_9PSEU|nr:glycosyltransferase 87 family protein [Herbihabitans rhizosphaerae]RZS43368.1 uncharacterized protein DUF2029 [Herbihabitans rhizosphaerae]